MTMEDRERAVRALVLVGGPFELLIQRVAKEIGEAREDEREACALTVKAKMSAYETAADRAEQSRHWDAFSQQMAAGYALAEAMLEIRARGTESKTGGR